MRENSRCRNDSSLIKRFDRDLFPEDLLYYNNLPTKLLTNFVSNQVAVQVQPCINKFRTDFIKSIQQMTESSIPEFIKAAKRRCNAFCEFVQRVMILSENGYVIGLETKNGNVAEGIFDIPFTKNVVGLNPTNNDVQIVSVDTLNHPREYRYIFRAMLLVLHGSSTSEEISMVGIILQSWAHIYESVSLTNSEIVNAEQEFLLSATKPDSTFSSEGELGQLLKTIDKDISSPQSPAYVSDLRKIRGFHKRWIRDNPWSIQSGWFSLKSSGSKLANSRLPNVGIIYSLLESDYTDPIDDIIGYKSMYRHDKVDGLVQYQSLSMFVPKTSSRGLRAIHPQPNPKQDRGQYFESMERPILNNILRADSTASHQIGVDFIKRKTFLREPGMLLACTDIKAATDEISHQFLKTTWNILFQEGIADGLLRLHSGPGTIRCHSLNRDGSLSRKEFEYTQTSGIRCGTSSNFAVGLALPHHMVVRATMLAMGLRSVDPQSVYVMVGDDVVFYLPEIYGLKFIETYTRLANEAGFRVHSLESKGKISYSSDIAFAAEFSKQDIVNGGIRSRIPHKLFFRRDTPQDYLSALIWLSKYPQSMVNPSKVLEWINESVPDNSKMLSVQLWNFFVKQEAFNIPPGLSIPGVAVDDEQEFLFSLAMFRRVTKDSIYTFLLDNRDRLSDQDVQDKRNKFFNLTQDNIVEGFIESFNCSMGEEGIGKFQYVLSLNQRLAEAANALFDDDIIELAIECGFFSSQDERDLVLRGIEISLHPEIVTDYKSVSLQLQKVTQIFKSVNPHSLAKSNSRSAKTFLSILNECVVTSLGISSEISQGVPVANDSMSLS